MRVLVCGGRDYNDWYHLCAVLARFRDQEGIDELCHGAATGADTLAGQWARTLRIPVEEFPADWNAHGRAAGPIRNSQMLHEFKPDVVIAFPGGRGTANMKRQALNAGVRIVEA